MKSCLFQSPLMYVVFCQVLEDIANIDVFFDGGPVDAHPKLLGKSINLLPETFQYASLKHVIFPGKFSCILVVQYVFGRTMSSFFEKQPTIKGQKTNKMLAFFRCIEAT